MLHHMGAYILSNIVEFSAGKPVIKAVDSFCHIINAIPKKWDYEQTLNDIENAVKSAANVTNGALSNTRGRWYEWMVSIEAFNYWAHNNSNLLLLNLPNASQFDSATLYSPEIFSYVQDLRSKLEQTLDINLVTSNPDFVLIDTSLLPITIERTPIANADSAAIEFIDKLYAKIIGRCELDALVGYLSLKTSVRPDRRLQIAHEGSLTKATYVHLQTRSWIMEPRGIKYFGAALALGQADIKGLKTVATHSITTVMSKPERAVDEVFVIKDTEDLHSAIEEMTNIIGF